MQPITTCVGRCGHAGPFGHRHAIVITVREMYSDTVRYLSAAIIAELPHPRSISRYRLIDKNPSLMNWQMCVGTCVHVYVNTWYHLCTLRSCACSIYQDFQLRFHVEEKDDEVARRLKLLRESRCSLLTCRKLTSTLTSSSPTLATAST